MAKPERSDKLRRRPETVRYFYLAVGSENLHTGMSWGGLKYVQKTDGVEGLFLSDLTTGKVTQVTEDIDTFLDLWRNNYNDPTWEYKPSKLAGKADEVVVDDLGGGE